MTTKNTLNVAIRRAKGEGLAAEEVWLQLSTGARDTAKKENWRPSELAVTLGNYQLEIVKVYGKRATRFLETPRTTATFRLHSDLLSYTQKLETFVAMISRMKTEKEYGDNAPPSEDWITTLNQLIAEARKLCK